MFLNAKKKIILLYFDLIIIDNILVVWRINKKVAIAQVDKYLFMAISQMWVEMP